MPRGMVMVEAGLVEALRHPSMYPESTQHIEVHETHTSIVFVTDHYVYKIKKDVNFGFLDYSTLDRRQYYCQKEVDLNRRLSHDIYLQVVAIRRNQGRYCFNGHGPIIEYVVKMRRLPNERNLEFLVRHGAVTSNMVDRLAQRLANFHTTYPYPPSMLQQGYGSKTQVLTDWQENFAQTSIYIPELIEQDVHERLQQTVITFLDRHADWFDQRVTNGHIRDCHGDLRAEHVYFLEPDQIRIIDCIEFNQRFRYIDVASEIAFLAMDLDRLGCAGCSNQFVQAYVKHASDLTLYRLLDFYRCYRAFVRGKVSALNLCRKHEKTRTDEYKLAAQNYFRLASQEANHLMRPFLIVTTGLIGSGKSSVASGIAKAFGIHILGSDEVRKKQLEIDPMAPHHVPYGAGFYSNTVRQHIYAMLTEKAEALLQDRQSVILDASFSHRTNREKMAQLARANKADFLILQCAAPDNVIENRLKARVDDPSNISDGHLELLPSFKRHYEDIHESERNAYIAVDTSQPLTASIHKAVGEVYTRKRQHLALI